MSVVRNATEITSPSGLPDRPSSALRQQLHSLAMRLLSRLEYERSYGASWSTYFVRIPNVIIEAIQYYVINVATTLAPYCIFTKP